MLFDEKIQIQFVKALFNSEERMLPLNEWQSLYEYCIRKNEFIEREKVNFHERKVVKSGTLVHLVRLSRHDDECVNSPKEICFNHLLEDDIELTEFKELTGSDYDSPGRWFIKQGFTVYSNYIDGVWLQIAVAHGYTNIESYIDCDDKNGVGLVTNYMDGLLKYHGDELKIDCGCKYKDIIEGLE